MTEIQIREKLWQAQTPHASARAVLDALELPALELDAETIGAVAEEHRRVARALERIAGAFEGFAARRRHGAAW